MLKSQKRTSHFILLCSVLTFAALLISLAQWRGLKPAVAAPIALVPTKVTVCHQVEDNGDADHTQGGTFGFIVSDQANTLGSLSLTRVENQAANPPVCSAPITIPGGSTQLQVLEASFPPTSTWPRNEGGYPKWTATNGVTTITGSGNVPADISSLSGDVTITFSNRVGRKVTFCKLVQPNAITPNNQGGTWNIEAYFPPVIPGVTLFPITADETSGTVCLPPVNLPPGATSVDFAEGIDNEFPGFPKWNWTTTGGQSASGAISSRISVPAATTSGDITITVINKFDEPRFLSIYSQLLDNGDATNDGGEFRFMTSYFGATIFSTFNMTEGGPVFGSDQGTVNIPSSVAKFNVGASQYHPNWPGNAIGYPKWELRDGNNPATLLASGTGDYTTVDYAALGVSNVRFVMINKAGPFGNGSDPTTGKIMRVCKRVDNNGNATDDGLRFRFLGLEFGVLNGIEIGFGAVFDRTVKESDGLVCDYSLAVHNGDTEFQVKEAPVILEWPGHAPGYPKWEVLNPANTVLQNGQAVDLPGRYGNYLAAQINTATLTGDSTFVMHNKAGNRKLTMCVNVMDNGFAPIDSAKFQLGFVGGEDQETTVTAEGSTNCVVFGAPSISTQLLGLYIPPAPWPGFAYGFPTYSYTTTGGGSGSGSPQNGGGYYYKNFDFADPVNAGDITLTFNVKPGRRMTVCKQLLNNGDGIDNSGTFKLGQGTEYGINSFNLTATEGGTVICGTTDRIQNGDFPTQAIVQELSLPTNWPGNTPGFPLFKWTTTGGQSGIGSGNNVTFDLTNTPGVSGIENTTGDITVTFLNRTGPPRVLTLCKEVEDNGDGVANQGGIFTLTGGGDVGTPATYQLTQTEGQPRVCSPPITLDPLATTFSAMETAPGNWPGNAAGFPQWTLLDGANAIVTSGTGTPTSNLSLSSFTGNPTIVFRNRATLMETGICVEPPSGLVSWWRGEANANDSKDGNNGTLVGGVTFAPGKVGSAFQLDGVDDYVLLPNGANLNFGTGDFSIEAWVKTSFIGGTGNKIILGKLSVGQDIQYALAYQANTDGKALFIMGNGATSAFVLSPSSIADGLFHHLAGVRHGLNLELYVDGVLAASAPTPTLYSATSSNSPIIGGRLNPGNTPYFNGLIDEAAIYNRALSASEIQSLVLAGSAGKCANTPPTITAGSVTRQQGSPSGLAVNIATVSDAEDVAGSLSVAVIAGGTATGITLGPLTNNNGTITATVTASCIATAGTVRLQVTDSGGLTATSDLQININANTAPTLTYLNQTVIASQPLTVPPATGPSDNGSVASLAVLSVTPAMTTAPTVASDGKVTITNAGPSGSHTITIRATDNCGMATDTAFTLNVTCPTITVSPATIPDGTVGQPYLSTSFSATGANGSVTFSLNGTLPNGMSLVSGQLAGTPTQSGSFPITITATDVYGCSASKSYTLVIYCPTIVISPSSLPIAQISTAYASQTFTATGGNAPYTISPSGTLPTGMSFNSSTLAGTPTQPGNFPLTVNVTDKYGCTASRSYTLTVNRPPVASSKNVTVTADANCTASADINNGSSDPDGDTLTITQTPAGPYAVGTRTVTLTVDDGHGGVRTSTATVTVNAPKPVPVITGPTSGTIYAVGTPVNFTGTFTDLAGTTHTASWLFDTLTQAGTVIEPAGTNPGTVSATRTFTAAGVYLVTLTVTNQCGGQGQTTTTGVDQFTALVVIYDPGAGFVTGGGWITSPAGAFVQNPTLTGKANFGFVSKYQPGATVPTGETEFQFKLADLNFHSSSYEWLVVAGARAQYKGTGTINGSGNYGFMLTAIDGQINGGGGVDKFRLKIWDKNNSDKIVYDNQVSGDTSDVATPNTAIDGGSIVIHK